MDRSQAENNLSNEIQEAWGPYFTRDAIPQTAFRRRIGAALGPALIDQYKDAARSMMLQFITEDSIDDDEIDELAQESMSRHSAMIAGLITDTTTTWVEDDQNNERAFSQDRSDLIAITEITNARSLGKIAAKELLAEIGIDVIGIWETAEDERVCAVCGPFHLTPESYWLQFFPKGPAAHPRCRCETVYKEKGKRRDRKVKRYSRAMKRPRGKKRMRASAWSELYDDRLV